MQTSEGEVVSCMVGLCLWVDIWEMDEDGCGRGHRYLFKQASSFEMVHVRVQGTSSYCKQAIDTVMNGSAS